MKIPKQPLLAAIFGLAAAPFLVTPQVHADTYVIYNLGDDNDRPIVGIDTSGQVVILNEILSEYLTYANGVLVNTTSTLPALTYDNGTPCSPPSGFSAPAATQVVCNNGRTGFWSFLNPNSDPDGVYTGPTSSLTLVDSGSAVGPDALNASGDFAWSDGQSEFNFEAVDISAPEPATLWLFGSGCLTLVGLLRRKLS
jgi:hypothetical protein